MGEAGEDAGFEADGVHELIEAGADVVTGEAPWMAKGSATIWATDMRGSSAA